MRMKKNIDRILLKLNKEKKEIQETINRIENIEKYSNENKIIEGDSRETIILKKYLELGTLKKVTDFLNELGYKVFEFEYKNGNKPGRKYMSSDITEIILNEELKVNKELQEIAWFLLNINSMNLQRS